MPAGVHRDIIDRYHTCVLKHVRSDTVPAQLCDFGLRFDAAAFSSTLAEGYSGTYEMTEPGGDIVFTRGDISFVGRSQQQLLGEDVLRIRLGLVGMGRFEGLPESSPLSYSGRSCYLIDQPRGNHILQKTDGDSRHCGVTLLLPRRVLSELWQFDREFLPPLLRDFEMRDDRVPRALIMELSPELAVAATEIMQCRLSGPLLRLYLDGKAKEIVSLIAARLTTLSKMESAQIELSRRDVKLLHDAYTIIEKQYITPPGIEELALSVGLNRNKLCSGFKQLFGAPIFEYCRELRLQHALRLLKETDTPLVEIALQIGFRHAPAFSSAFKRRFGCSPKQFRNSGSLLPSAGAVVRRKPAAQARK